MIEAWRIGVSIAVSSNGDQVLGVLLRHLTGIHAAAGLAKDKLDALKTAAIGALGVFAGTTVLAGIWDAVKASQDLNRQLERLKLAGASPEEVAGARMAAFQAANAVPTSTPAGNVKLLGELRSQLGSISEAEKVLPIFAQLTNVLSVVGGKSPDDSIAAALKVADLRGAVFSKDPKTGAEYVDVAKLTGEVDAMTRAITASGGLLGPNDFLQFTRQAGLAGRTMDQKAFYYMAEAMTAMGASRAGTAETGLFQQMASGMTTKRVAEEMVRVGLMQSGDYRTERGGQIVFNRDVTQRLGNEVRDPLKFVNDDLIPRLQKMGMSHDDMLIEVFRLFGRQTVQRLVGELAQGNPQFERFKLLFGQAQNIGQGQKELQANDLGTNIASFTAAWQGLMQALGEAGVPLAITILHGLTDGIHAITDFVASHPETARLLLEFATGLSALLILGGGIMVANVAINGLGFALSALLPAAGAFAAGGAGAAGLAGVALGLTRLIGVAGLVATALSLLDPRDKVGGWIDKHVPGASDIDNLFSHIGLGRSYADQQATGSLPDGHTSRSYINKHRHDPDLPGSSASNPMHVQGTVNVGNGRDLAAGVAAQQARQASRPSTGPTGTDPRSDGPYQGLMGAY